jgi:hypothetical protein
MKTFKDISWKQHEVFGIGSIQGILVLDNGIEFSIIAGKSAYSSKNFGVSESDFATFEVAIFDDNGIINQPHLWQDRKEIAILIKKHSRKSKNQNNGK